MERGKVMLVIYYLMPVISSNLIHMCILLAAILCQKAIRRRLAYTKVIIMRQELLQAQIVEKIRLQSIAHQKAATNVAKMWRKILCEKQLKAKADAATLISSCWRGYVARMVCVDILIGTLLRNIFSSHHASLLYSIRMFVSFAGIILFQSQYRRRLASKHVECLRQEREEDSAKKIQAVWRGFAASTRYTWSIYDIVTVQSLARRWLACRYMDEMLEEKKHQQTLASVKIQAAWRGYADYRDFMILLGGMFLLIVSLKMELNKTNSTSPFIMF
jgi:myosin heavy subunit